MMPNEKYIHLNSSVIKEIAKNGGDVSPFVTNSVNDALLSKFSS
jgi:phosphopantetheine adenylyltransferase